MASAKFAEIALASASMPLLDYIIPDELEVNIGDVVRVPFRGSEKLGIIYSVKPESPFTAKIKQITEKLPNLRLSQEFLNFLLKAAEYYLVPIGSIIRMVLAAEIVTDAIEPLCHMPTKALPRLSAEQELALNNLKAANKVSVLKGVTGSGKTEVYFHLVAEILNKGKKVLILLPEIGLSAQMIQRFRARFCFEPIIWNSSVSKAKKRKIFQQINTSGPLVVFGTRSSIFLPYKDLSLIVVDEEHDASYKQEDNVRYNARDMAVLRSTFERNKLLLLSATPSIETIYNTHIGKYNLVELDVRFGKASLPTVEVIDMRVEKLKAAQSISPRLQTAIKDTLDKGGQVLLFLNRKGYAPLLLCRACGHRVGCKHCSSYMVLHKQKKRLECHLCGVVSAIPMKCPDCGNEEEVSAIGSGIERVTEEVEKLFPDKKVLALSSEDMASASKAEAIVKRIESGAVDIIIGTQIITKGYHFPHLALVGILDADAGMVGGDLRAAERNYQLLHQVGGRAGREVQVLGKLLVQTYLPNSQLIEALKNFDDISFVNYELDTRKAASMPPYGKIAAIMVQSKFEEAANIAARKLVQLAPNAEGLRVLGPAPSSTARISRMFRVKILVICGKHFHLQKYLSLWMKHASENKILASNIKLTIDIDPYTLI